MKTAGTIFLLTLGIVGLPSCGVMQQFVPGQPAPMIDATHNPEQASRPSRHYNSESPASGMNKRRSASAMADSEAQATSTKTAAPATGEERTPKKDIMY